MQFRLSSPYPAPRPDRAGLLTGLFMGVFVAVFLLYFKPFGLGRAYYAGDVGKIAFFGLLTFISFMLVEVIPPRLFPALFQDRKWRVWHRIVYYLLLLLVIATLNGLYINLLGGLAFNWSNYASITVQTLSLGVLPITMIVLFRYNQKSVYYLTQAAEMQRARPSTQKPTERTASPKAPTVPVFLAAEAFGNYVKVYFATDEGYRQEVQRTTLVSLIAEREEDGVIRCHRSFAVSPAQVREVSGNAQGLKLMVGSGEREIPVSRTYLPQVRLALD